MQCCLLFHAQIRLWSLWLKIFGFFIACQSLYYTTERFIVPIIWFPPTFLVSFLSTPSLCHSRNHFKKVFLDLWKNLRGRSWNFPYIPCPHTCPASSTISSPSQNDTFGTIDESTLTHHNHPKSIVYMSLLLVLYMLWVQTYICVCVCVCVYIYIYIYTYKMTDSHHYGVMFLAALKFSVFLLRTTLLCVCTLRPFIWVCTMSCFWSFPSAVRNSSCSSEFSWHVPSSWKLDLTTQSLLITWTIYITIIELVIVFPRSPG